MPKTSWGEFNQLLSFMDRLGGKPRDPLEERKKIVELENVALRNIKLRKDLAAPGEMEKYLEEQRSQQVGSALEMFAKLWRDASPASKPQIAEQITSLWGMMNESDKVRFKMVASHTPINPKVQRAMWFDEVNPRPTMEAIIRYQMPSVGPYGAPTPEITNIFERTPANRRLWAEYDIALDEWRTLREMAIEEEKQGKKTASSLREVPKQYQTDDSNVTAERNKLTGMIEFTNWREIKATQAEVTTAIEKNWDTWSDIKARESVAIAAPREINVNGTLVTSTQRRNLKTGEVDLEYKPLGPLDESKLMPSDSLRDAANFATGNIDPREKKMGVKDAATLYYYDTLQDILNAKGDEQRIRLETFQSHLVNNETDPLKRFIPFLSIGPGKPTFWEKVFDWVPFVDFPSIEAAKVGRGQRIILRQADEMVPFFDKNGKQGLVWWSRVSGIAYYADGSIIRESQGIPPGSKLNIEWE